MYIGQYTHSFDSKNRLFLPSRFRTRSALFVLTRGLEECLYLYDTAAWQKVIIKLEELSLPDKIEERAFKRALLSGANEVVPDNQGRILLPQNLIEYAAIGKEVMIIGVGNRLEIWDSKRWEKYFREKADTSFRNMAAKLEI
ncbi:MAG: division/cell wall cluster transcriptional repressor MraZ [Elusimicrobia bacterium RIFOXYA2_FULL_50_26]|nr:MAG: division/cell wall cluster transcriptional repressor MraZ [Elusimicrobia bacterium RIFOXYA2_FULL_50_26]OGS24737.1 MAG: division/cell wall cluster transcriptional repressor MraZ [Elusimicrobia bacterium RIFOXYB2_FULL_50_12]